MFLILFFIFIVSLIWYVINSINSDTTINVGDSVPLIKNSFNVAFLNPEETFKFARKCAKVLKKSYRHVFFGLLCYNVIKAKDAEKILSSSKHVDKSLIYKFLHPFLKTGLLTSNGEKWHFRRRLLTPAFHFNILQQFWEVFREESLQLVETLKNDAGKEIDVIPISTQFALNTICETAMGVRLSDLGNDGIIYRNNICALGKKLLHRLLKPWLFFDFTYSLLGHRKELDKILVPIHQFTKSIIEKRKKHFSTLSVDSIKSDDNQTENIYFGSKKRRFAMLDTLLKAQRDGLIDDDGICEETDTFTFEGHDTTSSAMTFSLLLLANNPDAQEKIYEEIQETLHESKSDCLTIEDFNKMSYLDRALKECLRIYPPVSFISREFAEDWTHDGITYPKGSGVHIHILDVHRDEEAFPNPEIFDPDRFLPEACEKRNNFAFIAFSAGIRNCIGQKFAMLELKVLITEIIRNFKITPVTTREEIVLLADMIIRSKHPIKMRFNLRQ